MSLNRYGLFYDGNMRLNMDDKQIRTLEQVKHFIASSQGIEFNGLNLKEKYRWTEEVLTKFKYPRLKKAGKGVIRQYIGKVTGYSRAQANRLIWRYLQARELLVWPMLT